MRNGRIVVAIQEERLTGWKRQRIYPDRSSLAVQYCLDYAGIQAKNLNLVVDSSLADPEPITNRIHLNPALVHVPKTSISHHFAHAVSAFATSGFEQSAILVVDGAGSYVSELNPEEKGVICEKHKKSAFEIISLFEGRSNKITPLYKWVSQNIQDIEETYMSPYCSLGSLFTSTSDFIFREYEAGKVMALAAYGKPIYSPDLFFRISKNALVFRQRSIEEFKTGRSWPARKKDFQNLASSVQAGLETALLWVVQRLRKMSHSKNLCYAGGVALNSVANEKLIHEGGFDRVHIIPAAEDSGAAIGAAYYGFWTLTGKLNRSHLIQDEMGKTYSAQEIKTAIRTVPGLKVSRHKNYIREAANLIADGKIIGWFHGGSELGPRSLGQRSILCDPRKKDAKGILNNRVKLRENFQPFAPSVLLEHVQDWFEQDGSESDSPFMLRVRKFRENKRKFVPAVVHADGTGRLQTLTPERNGPYYDLVSAFHARTGVPILLNTSFNARGEPIVETPEDALWCLLTTGLDAIVFPGRIVRKNNSLLSILDLVPVNRFREWTLRTPVRKTKVSAEITEEADLEIKTDTQWGNSILILPPHLLNLFSLINGKKNGHELFRDFTKAGYSQNIQRFVILLGQLRRSRCIDLFSANSSKKGIRQN
jgi:carbamoyltransferase